MKYTLEDFMKDKEGEVFIDDYDCKSIILKILDFEEASSRLYNNSSVHNTILRYGLVTISNNDNLMPLSYYVEKEQLNLANIFVFIVEEYEKLNCVQNVCDDINVLNSFCTIINEKFSSCRGFKDTNELVRKNFLSLPKLKILAKDLLSDLDHTNFTKLPIKVLMRIIRSYNSSLVRLQGTATCIEYPTSMSVIGGKGREWIRTFKSIEEALSQYEVLNNLDALSKVKFLKKNMIYVGF